MRNTLRNLLKKIQNIRKEIQSYSFHWVAIFFFMMYLLLNLDVLRAAEIQIQGESIELKKNSFIYKDATLSIEFIDSTAIIHAKHLKYVPQQKTITARDEIYVFNSKFTINAHSSFFDYENDTLVFDKVVFFDKKNFIYIEAERLERIKKNTFLFKNVSYTNCPPLEKTWSVSTGELFYEIENFAVSQNTVIKINNLPIFYSPWWLFNTTTQRSSGFLPLQLETSFNSNDEENYGARVSASYFIALRENFDWTVGLDIFQNRGVALQNEINYLSHNGIKTKFYNWYLPENNSRNNVDENIQEKKFVRHHTNFQYKHHTEDYGHYSIFYYQNSDNEVFNEYFDTNIDYHYNFQKQLNYTYYSKLWQVEIFAENTAVFTQQSISDTSNDFATRPQRLPEIQITHFSSALWNSNLTYTFQNTTTYFSRQNGWQGYRNIPQLEVSYPFISQYHHTHISLTSFIHMYDIEYNEKYIDEKRIFQYEYFKLLLENTLFLNLKLKNSRIQVQPTLQYYKVPDFNQRQALNFNPDQNLQYTLNDYEEYEPIFDVHDSIYSQEKFSFNLNLSYDTQRQQTYTPLLDFDISVIYNLQRQNSTEDKEQFYKGYTTEEEYQELPLGEKILPLRLKLIYTPTINHTFFSFMRYDIYEQEFVEQKFTVTSQFTPDDSLTIINHQNNKTYREEEQLHFKVHYWEMFLQSAITSVLNINIGTQWNYLLDEDNQNYNNPVVASTEISFQNCCLKIAAKYQKSYESNIISFNLEAQKF